MPKRCTEPREQELAGKRGVGERRLRQIFDMVAEFSQRPSLTVCPGAPGALSLSNLDPVS